MPLRPPAPSKTNKSKKAAAKAKAKTKRSKKRKIILTPQQRIKVQIIDWKRCSVRSLLLIAYVTISQLIFYPIMLTTYYRTAIESEWLLYAYSGFIVSLILCFLGLSAAVNAITYAWNPVKFTLGILIVIIAFVTQVAMNFVGHLSLHGHTGGVLNTKLTSCSLFRDGKLPPENVTEYEDHWGFVSFMETCDEIKSMKTGIFFMPWILPPFGLLCTISAVFSAIKAIYIVPKKSDVKIDAAWLEPYETYEFYVGKNIPRIPGYDEIYEGALIDASAFSDSSSDSENGSTVTEGAHQKKSQRKKAAASKKRLTTKILVKE